MISTREDELFDRFNASIATAVDAVRQASEAIAATDGSKSATSSLASSSRLS